MKKPKYKVGQWVRFYNGGVLVIGVIEYKGEESKHYPYEFSYATTEGTVSEDRILESR